MASKRQPRNNKKQAPAPDRGNGAPAADKGPLIVGVGASAGGLQAFNAADYAFHDTLAGATGNDLLVALTRWVSDVFQPSLIKHVGARTHKRSILAQHRAIAAAVRASDVAGAEQAMRKHLDYLVGVLRKTDSGGASR